LAWQGLVWYGPAGRGRVFKLKVFIGVWHGLAWQGETGWSQAGQGIVAWSKAKPRF